MKREGVECLRRTCRDEPVYAVRAGDAVHGVVRVVVERVESNVLDDGLAEHSWGHKGDEGGGRRKGAHGDDEEDNPQGERQQFWETLGSRWQRTALEAGDQSRASRGFIFLDTDQGGAKPGRRA